MESSQPVITFPPPASGAAVSSDRFNRMQDEDVALGVECANPALQIERWGSDQAQHQVGGAY